MIYDIHSEADFDTLVGGGEGWVLLDFFASWCRPCKMMAPVLEKADAAMGGEVKFCRVDVDAMEDFAEPFQLVGVPTFILFRDGMEKGRIIGYNDSHTFMEKLRGLMAEGGETADSL